MQSFFLGIFHFFISEVGRPYFQNLSVLGDFYALYNFECHRYTQYSLEPFLPLHDHFEILMLKSYF